MDPAFVNSINEAEQKSWISFVTVIKNFPGKSKAENHVEPVNEMLIFLGYLEH